MHIRAFLALLHLLSFCAIFHVGMGQKFPSITEDLPAVPISYGVVPKMLSNLHAVFLRVAQLKPEAQKAKWEKYHTKLYKKYLD